MVDLDEKYYPHNIAWIVLNRLKEFNDKPEFIREFDKTKSFRREKKDHICFTTRSILEDIGMEELVKTHKRYVIDVLNTCFNKAFKKGILKEKFEYKKETFNKYDKVHINIPINPDFQW